MDDHGLARTNTDKAIWSMILKGGSGGPWEPAAQCGECLDTVFPCSWRKRVTV